MPQVSDTTKIILSIFVAGVLIVAAVLTDGRGAPEPEAGRAASNPPPVAVGAEHLSVSAFNERVSDPEAVVIDVRTSEEYNSGYITGALNVDFYNPEFASDIAKLDKSKSYAVYCRTDNRSGQALALMNEMGFADVVDLEGGIVAWLSADMAVRCSAGKVCMR